ncbi:MAG: sugar kinase [Xanthobacteraceae bacterium]|nr:sugar kinase [Xanthobacteraceae bacterium]
MNFHDQPQLPKILCIGMPVRDLVFRVDDLPARGLKKHASHYTEISGGNALNAAIAIARLGGRPFMTGPMGDAAEKGSATIFDDFAKEGINGSTLVRMPGLVTPISNILIDDTGERTIVTFRDPGLWKVKLPHETELLKDCAAVLVENRCADFSRDLCLEAHRRGIPVILDADQVMPLTDSLLQAATHIIFSEEVLRGVAGSNDDAVALRKVASLTPAFVAVTNGSDGMTWLDPDGQARHMEAFPIKAVDTLGAGDVFHGAFTLAMAERHPIEEAMRFSAAAAAIKCTRHGGAFAAPQRPEIEAFLGETKKRLA